MGRRDPIDQFAANVIGNTTPRKSLELGVRVLGGVCPPYVLCRRWAATAAGDESDAGLVATFQWSESPFDEQVLAKQAHKSVLDAARAQYAALRKRVGQADRIKLEQHTAMLRALEVQLFFR